MSILATIDALHRELDAHPDAHDTRLILADALEDAGGEWAVLAEGYRALGALQFRPHQLSSCWWYSGRFQLPDRQECHRLPWAWYEPMHLAWLEAHPGATSTDVCVYYEDRREAEDAAALAFAKLPAERRAQLLATPPANPAGVR